MSTNAELSCPVEDWMLEDAFTFGLNYFQNPAKVVKDRTGEKNRGIGEILTANLNGKLVEYGVKTILENLKPGKELIIDDEVRSNFDYSQPDIVRTKLRDKVEEHVKKFVEIKNSPANFVWINLYERQFDGIKKYVEKNISTTNPLQNIVIIYARIIDKFGETISSSPSSEDGAEAEYNAYFDGARAIMGRDKSLLYLTAKQRKELEEMEEETKKLQEVKELHPKLNLVNKHKTKKAEIIVRCKKHEKGTDKVDCVACKKELQEVKNSLADSKKIVGELLETNLTAIKNLKTAYKKRKGDLLGVYLKHVGFQPANFDYFFDVSDLKVKIDYIISGEELEKHGKLFKKKEILPSPEIFTQTESPYDNSGVLVDTNSNKYEDVVTSSTPVDIPININDHHKYPPQFGRLRITKGKARIVKHISTRKEKKKTTTTTSSSIIVCCDDKVTVEGQFLGKWNFDKEECWRMQIVNKLGGSKGKSNDDIMMPKRRVAEIIPYADVLKRAKKLVEEI